MLGLIIALAVIMPLCAIFYRLGGLGKTDAERYHIPTWMCHSKVRDIGIPIICAVWMILFFQSTIWWKQVIAFGIMFASLTTYFDSVPPKGIDKFWLHGLAIGAAYLLYSLNIFMFGRAIIISLFMHILCNNTTNDWVEELGRGGIIGATLPLLLLIH